LLDTWPRAGGVTDKARYEPTRLLLDSDKIEDVMVDPETGEVISQ